MRRTLLYSAAAALVALGLLSAASAREPVGPQAGGKAAKIVLNQPAESECGGDHGTAVKFYKSPSEAAREALKAEKLVFVLHISGLFEDPDFT